MNAKRHITTALSILMTISMLNLQQTVVTVMRQRPMSARTAVQP
jgi:hypothetical protein